MEKFSFYLWLNLFSNSFFFKSSCWIYLLTLSIDVHLLFGSILLFCSKFFASMVDRVREKCKLNWFLPKFKTTSRQNHRLHFLRRAVSRHLSTYRQFVKYQFLCLVPGKPDRPRTPIVVHHMICVIFKVDFLRSAGWTFSIKASLKRVLLVKHHSIIKSGVKFRASVFWWIEFAKRMLKSKSMFSAVPGFISFIKVLADNFLLLTVI